MSIAPKMRLPLAFTAAVAIFALGAWASPFLNSASSQVAAATTDPVVSPKPDLADVPGGSAPNYRAIVARFGPSVVGVNTEGTTPVSNSGFGFDQGDQNPFGDDPFFQFFRNLPMPQGRVPMRGQGSGFIISSDGLILTNAHVVRDADRVSVKLSDRREFKAKVLGVDQATDIAVLRIKAHDLPTVQFGDSDQLAVGDYVLAIGAPYGFEESATSGIVSAKGRELPGDSYVPFIQTDVAVNPGNSGGPLFDAAGNVVGINSQIYSNTGGYEGLSFAIPIKVALHVKDEIVKSGHVEHARLGVMVQPLTQPLAQSFHLEKPDGALVSSVAPGSAAARAGIKPGDVILAYNDHDLQDAGDLSSRVGLASPGDEVMLKVWRERKTLMLEAKLGQAQDVAQAGHGSDGHQGKLGVAVRPLSPDERKDADLKGGLMVEGVSGPAEAAGIQPGDIILSVNGTDVRTVAQLREMVAGQDQQVALLIARGGSRIFVPVPLA